MQKQASKTYEQICNTYQKYITDEHLKMLHHPWTTQANEALNRSVSAYAPKDRTYSKTESLMTRVDIAAAIHNVGHETFWRRIFRVLNLHFDDNLVRFLRSLDVRKQKQKLRAATKEGKSRRSKSRCEKYSTALKSHIRDHREGMEYESGIAIKKATKIAKYLSNTTARNPEGTPKEELKCRFNHPLFCTKLGHTSCRSKECMMNSKSKVERDSAAKTILDEMVKRELHLIHAEGK